MRSVGIVMKELNRFMAGRRASIDIRRMFFPHIFSVVVDQNMALVCLVNTVEVYDCKGKDQI